MGAEIQPDWFDPGSNDGEVIVTDRDFETVSANLRIPGRIIDSRTRMLSVGEGFSDYAKGVGNKYGAKVWALDPIYSVGKSIFYATPQDRGRLLEGVLDSGKLRYNSRNYGRPAVLEHRIAIAGSVFDLPFPDKTFDFIVGNNVTENVNLLRALPELLRCIKPSGEIRFSNVLWDIDAQKNFVYPVCVNYDGSSGEFFIDRYKGAEESLEFFAENEDAFAYLVPGNLPKRSEVFESYGFYETGILIIRKDRVLPEIIPFSRSEKTRVNWRGESTLHEKLGDIYLVKKGGKVSSMDWIGNGFEIMEVSS